MNYYCRSLGIEPTAEAHTFLGWTYSMMGRTDDAIGECLKAINIDPEFGTPYNDIGSYLLRMGRFDDAIPWLQKAKQARRYQNPEFACGNIAKAYEFKGLILPAVSRSASQPWKSAPTGPAHRPD